MTCRVNDSYVVYAYKTLIFLFLFSTSPQSLGMLYDQFLQFYASLLPSLERYRYLLNNPDEPVSLDLKISSFPYIHCVSIFL